MSPPPRFENSMGRVTMTRCWCDPYQSVLEPENKQWVLVSKGEECSGTQWSRLFWSSPIIYCFCGKSRSGIFLISTNEKHCFAQINIWVGILPCEKHLWKNNLFRELFLIIQLRHIVFPWVVTLPLRSRCRLPVYLSRATFNVFRASFPYIVEASEAVGPIRRRVAKATVWWQHQWLFVC